MNAQIHYNEVFSDSLVDFMDSNLYNRETYGWVNFSVFEYVVNPLNNNLLFNIGSSYFYYEIESNFIDDLEIKKRNDERAKELRNNCIFIVGYLTKYENISALSGRYREIMIIFEGPIYYFNSDSILLASGYIRNGKVDGLFTVYCDSFPFFPFPEKQICSSPKSMPRYQILFKKGKQKMRIDFKSDKTIITRKVFFWSRTKEYPLWLKRRNNPDYPEKEPSFLKQKLMDFKEWRRLRKQWDEDRKREREAVED